MRAFHILLEHGPVLTGADRVLVQEIRHAADETFNPQFPNRFREPYNQDCEARELLHRIDMRCAKAKVCSQAKVSPNPAADAKCVRCGTTVSLQKSRSYRGKHFRCASCRSPSSKLRVRSFLADLF